LKNSFNKNKMSSKKWQHSIMKCAYNLCNTKTKGTKLSYQVEMTPKHQAENKEKPQIDQTHHRKIKSNNWKTK